MDYSIRQATQRDTEMLAELGAETFVQAFKGLYSPRDLQAFLDRNHTPAAYAALISQPRTEILLAEQPDQRAVGYAVAGPCKLPLPDPPPDPGELHRLYLTDACRGRGVGGQLMRAVFDFLSTQFDAVYLGVYSENFGAHRFYQRHGFVKVGQYEFMVGDQADAEWIMEWRGKTVSE